MVSVLGLGWGEIKFVRSVKGQSDDAEIASRQKYRETFSNSNRRTNPISERCGGANHATYAPRNECTYNELE